MRLKNIKMAGFKSFVDPTFLHITGDLVGIVGPNGCGKSNIVDAIRWVLGETSAKQIRGQSMQDVIFEGSPDRKSSHRASVELIFDNSLGKLTGMWAKYTEISVKRFISKDGESSYYINNQQVRKRDVSDIFLGTGLGGNGYAIIEQGMISRIIDAKPEDLRSYLEEAAGVSQYKERRKETESKLKNTRDNLVRINDIREELKRQIQSLNSQARKAEFFKEIEKKIKIEENSIDYIEMKIATKNKQNFSDEINSLKIQLEKYKANLSKFDLNLIEKNNSKNKLQKTVELNQRDVYKNNSEIDKLEQKIRFQEENRDKAKKNQDGLNNQIIFLDEKIKDVENQVIKEKKFLNEISKHKQEIEKKLNNSNFNLPDRVQLDSEENKLFELAKKNTKVENSCTLHRVKLSESKNNLEQLKEKKKSAHLSKNDLIIPFGEEIKMNKNLLSKKEADLKKIIVDMISLEKESEKIKSVLDEIIKNQNIDNDKLQKLIAKRNVLEDLQEVNINNKENEYWLSKYSLEKSNVLWKKIKIKDGWEFAIESLIGERLNSISTRNILKINFDLNEAPANDLTIYDQNMSDLELEQFENLTQISQFIEAEDKNVIKFIKSVFKDFYICTDENALKKIILNNKNNKKFKDIKILTQNGSIFSNQFFYFKSSKKNNFSYVSRKKEIETLGKKLKSLKQKVVSCSDNIKNKQLKILAISKELSEKRNSQTFLQKEIHDLELSIIKLTKERDGITFKSEQLELFVKDIDDEIKKESLIIEENTLLLKNRLNELEEGNRFYEKLNDNFKKSKESYQTKNNLFIQTKSELNEFIFKYDLIEKKIQDLKNREIEYKNSLSTIKKQLEVIKIELVSSNNSDNHKILKQKIEAQTILQKKLTHSQDSYEDIISEIKQIDFDLQKIQATKAKILEVINEKKMKQQEFNIIEQNFLKKLNQADADFSSLRNKLDKINEIENFKINLNKLKNKLENIGPVNLSALNDLDLSNERKKYLDEQYDDLTKAVEALNKAIKKIDLETKEKLNHTFKTVNENFNSIFPKLFGGGHANLKLSGDEILDTGIEIIAKPPGKNISSIRLLSGGEKALTAISLVFSFFKLNPAPFCLLDEVDAPLDDNNVINFTDLVKKMSLTTQFIFVTHNKLTMELADNLIGITMKEKGVSKAVEVDVNEAIKIKEKVA